ncbi:hypothetical protein B0H10DRAFT_102202 [Mycena sp. CBHHK59/15]|nr:hypothetical protein B0H10DRAFT_102202 [Mycena sp. CBHHK59/15]
MTTESADGPTSGSYPPWVYFPLPPSDSPFDVTGAIELVETKPHKWSAIQIIVPLIVGLSVAAILVVGFFYCRRRKIRNRQQHRPWMKTTGNRPRFQFPSISSVRKVRSADRSSSWSIDERVEDLGEYQFVSYPVSLQESRASGHVRLSSSSTNPPSPPMIKIPTARVSHVWSWPGKTIWRGPLEGARQLRDSIPRPWRRKRIAVQSIPSYKRFRVDASDSNSPLSQRSKGESLLGHPGRSRTNLHNEPIFERDDEEEDESDSDREVLPLIPQEHSRSNHDAEPKATNEVFLISRSPEANISVESDRPRRTGRQIPPASVPPSSALPLPPPPPKPKPKPLIRVPLSLSTPPAPTSPPPVPPASTRRSPRTLLPALPSVLPPLPPPPLLSPLSPPPIESAPLPSSPPVPAPQVPPPGRRSSNSSIRSLPLTPAPPSLHGASPAPAEVLAGIDDSAPVPSSSSVCAPQVASGNSSIRSLPFTPTPPYFLVPPAPAEVSAPATDHATPPHSAPPYVKRQSRDQSHSPVVVPVEPARSLRKLPVLPTPPSADHRRAFTDGMLSPQGSSPAHSILSEGLGVRVPLPQPPQSDHVGRS